ncbi:hypothetical protein GC209_10305 [bacterium]|nr:hypothetical protein [bacterium]
MKIGVITLMVLGLGAAAAPALADRTDVLYQYKSWQVEGVTFDDGTFACLAEVSDPGESFSIWTFPDKSIRLQFYSQDWDFGESGNADLEVEIDHRSPWSMTNASLTQNSVLFDLPDQKESVNFIVEVARGSTLHLRSSDGTPVKDYSLAGSSASINYLIDCGTAISGSKNPFN